MNMMKYFIAIITLLMPVLSCTVSNRQTLNDETLLTIEDEPVEAGEFMYVYEKNNFNNDSIYTPGDVDAYFELFKNFKLKIKAAKDEGVDTTQAFIQEYNGYKKQLLTPYLAETKEQGRLMREAYDRMKYEIDASHILVEVKEDAAPEDTLAAYQKMLEIHEKAKSGANFEKLAFEYSDDPSAKYNRGRLGYFTVFQMVYPFEDAAYRTPVDSVSDIIRTRFGYHILKINDKRPYSGKVKVSHIMLLTTGKEKEEASIKERIFEIHDQLMSGADWNELCSQYSEDVRTKNKSGTLPFISLRQVNDEAFENAAFSLQKPGEISDPVRSRFGWHIIRLEERQGLEPFEKIRDEIAQKVSKDGRTQLSKKAVIKKLKQQNNFREFGNVKEQLIAFADSTLLNGKWTISQDLSGSDTLFIIGQKPYTAGMVSEGVLNLQRKRKGLTPAQYMHELIDRFEDNSLLEYEEQAIVKDNFELRMLLREYYEGILLFDIMNRMVWNKAVQDTAGLKAFFENNRGNYYWGQRAVTTIISSPDEMVIDEIKDLFDNEYYHLMSVRLDPGTEKSVIDDPQLDSLATLYFKYSPAVIEIACNDHENKKYNDIRRFLNDMGIPEKSIIDRSPDKDDDKILVVLNSKSKKSLEYLYNKESALTLRVREGKFEKGDNHLIDSTSWKPGLYEFMENNQFFMVVIHEILDREPQELPEIKGKVITDYQDFLEEKWLEELNSKYSVKVNHSTLDKIKKSFKKKRHHPA